MTPKSKSLEECYEVARSEANRYQALLNKLSNHPQHSHNRAILLAKRNAASRIARLIQHGEMSLSEQEQQDDQHTGGN